jgi:hypothetical protein
MGLWMKEFTKKQKGNGSFGGNDAIQRALATCLSRWRKPAQRFKNSQNFQNPRFSRFRPGFSSILRWILVFIIVLILVSSRFHRVSIVVISFSIIVVSFLPHIIIVLASIVVVSRFYSTTATISPALCIILHLHA